MVQNHFQTQPQRELLGTPLNSAMEVLQDRARRLLRILDVKLIPKDERKGGVRMFGVISTAPRSWLYEKEKKWVCLKIGYIPIYSHLIGIMIINHWTIGYNGVHNIFRQTQIWRNASWCHEAFIALFFSAIGFHLEPLVSPAAIVSCRSAVSPNVPRCTKEPRRSLVGGRVRLPAGDWDGLAICGVMHQKEQELSGFAIGLNWTWALQDGNQRNLYTLLHKFLKEAGDGYVLWPLLRDHWRNLRMCFMR